MLYFKIENDKVMEISHELTNDQRADLRWICRGDIKSFEEAERIALSATELTGDIHIATNRPNCYPQFDVVRAPKVGDEVSYAFNGDVRICGSISKVSKSLKKVSTTTGKHFYRVKETGTWLSDRCWSLVGGHIDKRNPEF